MPDGRIFGLIAQNRPHGRKKLEAVNGQNNIKSGRKQAGKQFNIIKNKIIDLFAGFLAKR
jgi:hypothetical protein